jgi:DNA-binding CsgD family transcriptional regulator
MMSMNNTDSERTRERITAPAGLTASSIWEILVNDTQCCIVLADIDGEIRYRNSDDGMCIGKHRSCPFMGISNVTDELPREQAEQLLSCMKRSHENNSPIVLVWFLRGIRSRTVVRPIENESGPQILLTTRLATGVDFAGPSHTEGEVVHSVAGDAGPLASLTQRETEVLEMIGRGYSTAKIAESLNRSTKTIEWHRASIGNKLDASNRVELARIAISAGLTAL